MKIIVIQTRVIIEDDNMPQPKSQPVLHPFIELLNRLCGETAHGRITQQPEREDKEHGPYVPQ